MEMVINSSRYWFLDNISYTPNELKITIIEGIVGEEEIDPEFSKRGITIPTRPVEKTKESKIIEVIFRNVLPFESKDEMFSRPDKYEEPSRNTFREYSKSEFLDHSGSTYKNRRHYAIITETSVINVLSEYPPEIIQIK